MVLEKCLLLLLASPLLASYRADWEPSGKLYALCPWGGLEVTSVIVGAVHTQSSLSWMEPRNFKKMADFSSMHLEMG